MTTWTTAPVLAHRLRGRAVQHRAGLGVIGIALILMFRHLEGRERVVKPLLFVMAVLVISVLLNMASGAGLSALPDLLYAVVGTGLCIPLLLGYHGRRGYSLKYLFYIYYPLHILVLGLIATNLL